MVGEWWRWVAIFLAGIVVSMGSFWTVEARHYVTREEVRRTVTEVMGREAIMSSLERIESASAETRTRVRSLERTTTQLMTIIEGDER